MYLCVIYLPSVCLMFAVKSSPQLRYQTYPQSCLILLCNPSLLLHPNQLTHWKRPWCWERLKAGGEGDDRGWDGWMASPNQRTWVWASSGSWWWTGKPGVLQSMGLQRVRHNWRTELNLPRQTLICFPIKILYKWNHTVCTLFCLAYFNQHSYCEAPSCSLCVNNSFYCGVAIQYTDIPQFIHFVDGHWGCFWVLMITNTSRKNIYVSAFFKKLSLFF